MRIKKNKMPFLNHVELNHAISEKYRIKIALFHYAYLGTKSKHSLAELYDINLNSLKNAWNKSNYDKKEINKIV